MSVYRIPLHHLAGATDNLWSMVSGRLKSAVCCMLMAGLVVFAAPPAAYAGPQSGSAEVERWGRFERSVPNRRKYADPYRDVTLEVSYTRPDGTMVTFWGFYDGGDTWKIRFMPDQTGSWRYTARFSDGAPGVQGAFECVASGLPGLISRDEQNPQWFGFRGGKQRLLVRSFHVGDRFFAENWDAAKRTAFLDWAQGQGYNTLSIASHYLNRNEEGRGQGWKTPELWPLDAAEYRKMETILDELARRRLLVFPFAGFFGRGSNFPRDPAEQSLYIRYTLARLGPYWNLLFNVAGPEPNLRGRPFLTPEEVNRLGGEIRRLDVFGHLLTVHNPPGDDLYREAPWTTYGTLQGPKTIDKAKLSAEILRNHHPKKPLYAQETLWPGNTFGHPSYTDEDIRKNAYVILMSAAALNYADMNGSSSSGFSGTLELSDRVQTRHDIVKQVWDFFETVPFQRMKPSQDLVSRGYCLAEAGEEYLVYLESGGTVDVAVTGGPYPVEWINARDTSDRRPGKQTRDGRALSAPDENDWLLRLRQRGKVK